MDGCSPPVLKAVSISKEYHTLFTRKRQRAISDISFEVEGGHSLAIMGPNGAGKTTILKIILGIVAPDRGNIYIDGIDLIPKIKSYLNIIGYASSDERSFYWRITPKQNLLFFGSLYRLKYNELKDRILTLSNILGVNDYLDKPFQSLSTGIKQRFAILRALLHDPAILLLDEPTRSLDEKTAESVRGFINEKVKRKKTIIMVSHNHEEMKAICDTLLVLKEGGKIDYLGSPSGYSF